MFFTSSHNFVDELGWASIWLYKATGEYEYLDKAITFFPSISYPAWAFDWDDKDTGYQVSFRVANRGIYQSPKWRTALQVSIFFTHLCVSYLTTERANTFHGHLTGMIRTRATR